MDDLEALPAKQGGPKLEVLFLVHSQDSQSPDWATGRLPAMLRIMHRSAYESAKVAQSPKLYNRLLKKQEFFIT
jgi:hypothetical protein